ncbi:MAG: hypothetical protein ACK8QZ_05040, partial [Anaerolineales bacterium]
MLRRSILISLFLLLLSVACVSQASPPVSTPTPSPSATPPPTATPALPLAILVLPEDMDENASQLYQATVYDLAQSAGIRYQLRNRLSVEDLTSEPALKVVIAVNANIDLPMLAAAAPQAQFMAINIPGVQPGNNISLMNTEVSIEQASFLAGYIGAMLIRDYHIGMILPKDDAQARRALKAYENGKIFYCGLCRPFAGPFYEYPISVEVPADTPPEQYSAYVSYLMRYQVEFIYVYPSLAKPEMLEAISTNGLEFITATALSQAYPGLVATLRTDPIQAIRTA